MINLGLLLEKSAAFENDEARADVYPMVREWIEKHQNQIDRIRGVATLLIVWNAGYYGRAGRGFQHAVTTLEKLFKNQDFIKLMSSFEGLDLGKTCLVPLQDKIKSLYALVRLHEGLGIAGASKTLHLLVPSFFMMWDDKICDHYHDGHRERGQWHRRGGETCYYEFMREMQALARELLSTTSREEIEHRLTKIGGYPKTLAKGLDEFNYMTYTVPRRQQKIIEG